jgi:zinc transport system permease protein
MIDSFLLNAIFGGLIIASVSGLLGCFVLWKNMAYFGDALSHSALLGITIGILFHLNLTIAVSLVAILFAIVFSQNTSRYSNDTMLGVISYSALSLAIIVNSYKKVKMDLIGYLFGDILAINYHDMLYLSICTLVISIWIYRNWSELIMLSICEEYLHASGGNVRRTKLGFALVLALFIATSFKVVGILLITAMLIIPAASALAISRSPLQMAKLAVIIGSFSCICGIAGAFYFNAPTGPSIVVTSLLCFVITNVVSSIRK